MATVCEKIHACGERACVEDLVLGSVKAQGYLNEDPEMSCRDIPKERTSW